MGLNLISFKKGGVTFENAYAKLDRLILDNNTKIINFSIAIYSSNDKTNLITKIENLWCRPVKGVDQDIQCYNRIAELITHTKGLIANVESDILTTTDESVKMTLETTNAKSKESLILQLDGATSDEL